jgi:hypothetical protein
MTSADLTDRKLLTLAARACFGAGCTFGIMTRAQADVGMFYVNGQQWNPLTDDGDALRLAVKLGLRVRVCDDLGIAFCTSDDVPTHQASEGYGSDRYAATRRAIVRAAAEIGRSKA